MGFLQLLTAAAIMTHVVGHVQLYCSLKCSAFEECTIFNVWCSTSVEGQSVLQTEPQVCYIVPI